MHVNRTLLRSYFSSSLLNHKILNFIFAIKWIIFAYRLCNVWLIHFLDIYFSLSSTTLFISYLVCKRSPQLCCIAASFKSRLPPSIIYLIAAKKTSSSSSLCFHSFSFSADDFYLKSEICEKEHLRWDNFGIEKPIGLWINMMALSLSWARCLIGDLVKLISCLRKINRCLSD